MAIRPSFGFLMFKPLSLRRTPIFVLLATLSSSIFAWDFTILHVNDTHAAAAGVNDRGSACYRADDCTGGYARLISEVERIRAEKTAVLALDAGDLWQGTHYYRTGGPDWALATMRYLPWDAVTLGNHEFDEGCAATAQYVKALGKPVLGANFVKDPACALSDAPILPYVVKEMGGVRVGIVGLMNDEGREVSAACSATHFEDRETALHNAVVELETKGIRHIVALTHLGYEADLALAKAVPSVDVIVGGHTHSILGERSKSEGPYPTEVRHEDGGKTLVVQAGRSTRYVGELQVSFDPEGRIVSYEGDLKELTSDLPQDKTMQAFVVKETERIAADRARIVARNPVEMPDGLDPCREGDCLSGLWTADALLEWGKAFGAVGAFINGGALRAALPVGIVTHADILDVHPFGNRAEVADLTGCMLLSALEHGLSDPDVNGPRLLQTAGIRYRVDPLRPIGSRVTFAEILDHGIWCQIEHQKMYRIVTTSYLLEGGDKFTCLKDANVVESNGPRDADLLEEYLRRSAVNGRLVAPEVGRIIGMPGA